MNRKGPHLWLWCCAALLAPFTTGLHAQAAQTVVETTPRAAELEREARFDIPAQSLGTAMIAFAEQSGIQVVTAGEDVEPLQTPGVIGTYAIRDALAELLYGTGLVFVPVGNATIALTTPEAVQAGEVVAAGSEGATPAAGALFDPNVDVTPAPGGTTSVEVARRAGVEEIIVTGQKKAERLQDVPIAISAFSMETLDAQKIEGGFDLLKAVPNVTFSKTNFSGYNFQIRGIGTQAVSATTDPGVAVAFNNSTLIVNRLFEQEYLDVERVEVLRGPQGTLFGRNATGGVINVISRKPVFDVWEGMIDLETGSYGTQRLSGVVNVPLGNTLALRAAYASTERDGFGKNLAAGTADDFNNVSPDVDGRDLWSGRLTLAWQPTDALNVNLLWERFEEDDNRVRTSKQLCHRDPGDPRLRFLAPAESDQFAAMRNVARSFTSQSCRPGSLYSDEAYGTPNGTALPYISGMLVAQNVGSDSFISSTGYLALGHNPFRPDDRGTVPLAAPCVAAAATSAFFPSINICQADPYGGQSQSRDLRAIHSLIEPIYRAEADLFELAVDFDLGNGLSVRSQTVYVMDDYYASQDYNRYSTFPIFNDSSLACGEAENLLTGKTEIDCSDNPDSGRGTYIPLTDADGDGIIEQTGYTQASDPFRDLSAYAFDDDGYLRDVDGRRVGMYRDLTPGGVFCDPQLGCSRSLVAQDLSRVSARQFNQEFQLSSDFDGNWNFSLGANFTRFETFNDYFVFLNAATMISQFWPFNVHASRGFVNLGCEDNNPNCIYVDPNPLSSINGEGHNYFRSANPYELRSSALFGELYWNASDSVKVTLGARMTWDEKVFTPIPSQLLLTDYRNIVPPGASPDSCINGIVCPHAGTGRNDGEGARGSIANPDIVQEWREPTGRLVVDWQPDVRLQWLDESMMYFSLARGYKGGGANPPTIAPPAGIFNARSSASGVPPTFEPEYVNAVEVGTKNTLFGGGMILNANAFYYDYTDYQVSKIVDRTAANENFDAEVWGVELEWVVAPTANLSFNGSIGHLRTEIAKGESSIDLMDRAQGGSMPFGDYDEWVVVKPWIAFSSNCVAPLEIVQSVMSFGGSLSEMSAICPGGGIQGLSYREGAFTVPGLGRHYNPDVEAPNGGAGFSADLGGNELPSAPRWTFSAGGQYTMLLPAGWDATVRTDFYWQDKSFARVYNTEYDRLKAWTNTNVSLWFTQAQWGLTVEAYVKNLLDETPITGAFLNSDDSGLTTNVFTLDPKVYGLSVRKEF